MMALLTNHLWHSTVFALAAALLTLALRRNHAGVRYGVWLAASVKFLVPFAALMTVGALVPFGQSRTAAAPAAPVAFTIALDQIAQPFPDTFQATPLRTERSVPWVPIASGLWFAGFAAIVFLRLRGWRRIQRAVRASTPLALSIGTNTLEVRSAPDVLEPGVVGIRRPILLLPERIADRLTAGQLETVVVHEQCHADRRDNLTAAVHMLVEAAFWFHPLVWWIGARMVAERERACDEAVLARGLQPRDYADAIVKVCQLYVESPLACVAGVTGSNLRTRIEDIMGRRIGVRLDAGRKVVLACACAAAIALPVAVGAVTAPLRAQETSAVKAKTVAQRFEVASIRPCDPDAPRPNGRGGGGGSAASPGRLHIDCMSVAQLVNAAYLSNGERLLNDDPGYVQWPADGGQGLFVRPTERIRGGPDWAHTDKYTVDAKAEGTPDRKTMNGPMLRALLEDRFQLKTHRDVDGDQPMYALTVAKGGPKVKPWGAEDECIEWDRTQKAPPMKEVIEMIHRGEKPPCGLGVMVGTNGANRTFAMNGVPMDSVAYWLSSVAGRHVLDKTGLAGRYTLYLEYAPEGSTADPAGPSIFTAVQEQWGLKLEPAKGPRGYIAIDRVERPSVGGTSEPAQSAAVPATFDAASIRPCGDRAFSETHPSAQLKNIDVSGHHVLLDCATTQALINLAYPRAGGLRLNDLDLDKQVRGGPDWIRSDRYTVEANTSVDLTKSQAFAPMLQQFLEDRLQLRVRRDVEQVSMYALTVARDGLKIKPLAEGGCTTDDANADSPQRGRGPGAKPMCGMTAGRRRGPIHLWDLSGAPLSALADVLETDREVLDRTGVTGLFNIHLEYSPDTDRSDNPGVSVFDALQQQLGLKLVSTKGPHEYVVVDRVERPDPNR